MQLFSMPSDQQPTNCTSYTCYYSTCNITLCCPVRTSYANMPPLKAFPSVASSHWTDCFKELWSYSISPIWKLFIRVNKFTVKIVCEVLLRVVEVWMRSARGKGPHRSVSHAGCTITPPGNSLCW